MKLRGNLDCEARWAGVALPDAVQRRISLLAALFAACAPDDTTGAQHEIWVPAPVDPARLLAAPGWTPPITHVAAWRAHGGALAAAAPGTAATSDPTAATGIAIAPGMAAAPGVAAAHGRIAGPGGGVPQRAIVHGDPERDATREFDLAWADPGATAANDRAAALAIAGELGVALPGARVIASLAELDAHVAGLGGRPWICKARWTAAGRDRARGAGPATGELRVRLGRMLERFGPLVFEPWLDRVADLGVCGEVTAAGEVALCEPHGQRTDPRGGFVGIELAPAIDPGITDELCRVARAAAARLAARTGYRGRFAIDAFTYRDGGAQRLHPLCEINARHSFGWIARALAHRLGARRLGFDAPPAGATVLIAPGDDRVTAWCA